MSSLVLSVGWALLHFVSQGALVAALYAVSVRSLRTPALAESDDPRARKLFEDALAR